MAEVLDLFVDDDAVTFFGSGRSEQASGRSQLEERLSALLALPEIAEGSFGISWGERRVRVEGDVAWVTATGIATRRSPKRVVEFPYRLSGVLLARQGRWLWHTHPGSEPGTL